MGKAQDKGLILLIAVVSFAAGFLFKWLLTL